jgi:uncharacterized protein (TIGR00730 family)
LQACQAPRLGRIAVYCGSGSGRDPAYAAAARAFGRHLARSGIDLVYGGGRLGLMGAVADAVLEGGGRAYGEIPEALLPFEVAHPGLTELHRVHTLHQRKARMTELCDAFVALPGGIGTLDELLEAWTWNALGYHDKPLALLDVAGFWSGFNAFLDHLADEDFLSARRRRQLLVGHSPEEVSALLEQELAAAPRGMIW